MIHILNTLLVVVMMLNLFALGSSRTLSVIHIVAFQGALLGLLPLFIQERFAWETLFTVGPAIVLKGMVIPWMMIRAMRDIKIKREMDSLIGLQATVILGAAGTVLALLFADELPLAARHTGVLIVPAALATLFAGFIMLITRFKALTQVMGYLMLENGTFIFGMLLVEAMPFMIEIGVLLDLFVAIFVICIIVNRINQAFSSLDTRHLALLKE